MPLSSWRLKSSRRSHTRPNIERPNKYSHIYYFLKNISPPSRMQLTLIKLSNILFKFSFVVSMSHPTIDSISAFVNWYYGCIKIKIRIRHTIWLKTLWKFVKDNFQLLNSTKIEEISKKGIKKNKKRGNIPNLSKDNLAQKGIENKRDRKIKMERVWGKI